MGLRKFVGMFALLVFVASSIIHLLTYSGVNLAESYTAVWALFPVVIVIFVYTLLTAYPTLESKRDRRLLLHFQQMPKWMRVLIMVLGVYFTYNHVASLFFATPVPYKLNGKLIFNNHGHITEYTLEEAAQARLVQFRGWSGFLAWTSFVSTAYLLTATRRILPKA